MDEEVCVTPLKRSVVYFTVVGLGHLRNSPSPDNDKGTVFSRRGGQEVAPQSFGHTGGASPVRHCGACQELRWSTAAEGNGMEGGRGSRPPCGIE